MLEQFVCLKKFSQLLVLSLLIVQSELKSFNESCQFDSDCNHLDLTCIKTRGSLTCQCKNKLVWQSTQCVELKFGDSTIDLISLLSPLFVAVILTCIFLVVCCCCLAKNNEQLHSGPTHKYDVENSVEMYQDYSEENEKSGLNRPKSANKKFSTSGHTELKQISKSKSASSETISETTLTKAQIHVITEAPKIEINLAKDSGLTKPKSAEIKQDQGYQASLRLLFDRPSVSSEPNSRPLSAMTQEPGIYRSGSALNFGRQSSLSLLVPRDQTRPTSATSASGRRSPSINGPYLSDPSNLKFVQLRSMQLSPKNSFALASNYYLEEETSFSVESSQNNMKNVKEKENNKVESEKTKESKNVKADIRLVQAAVQAFKRKTR
jgi:hypothetical protein